MFTKAIVRPPAPNFSQGLTTAGLGAPDYARALAQHEAYCMALEQCGLKLIRLEADADFPDSTFVEDTAVLTERGAILTRPGAPSRAGEVETIREALAKYFPALVEIRPPGTVDGGDICQADDHFFIGLSERTNEAGAQQLANILASFDYTTSVIDIRRLRAPQPGALAAGPTFEILHLKSGLAYLGDNQLALIDGLAGDADLSDCELIRVDDDEAYAANCVRVNEQVLVASSGRVFARRLHQLGYRTIALEMSEFQKMDGGLSCLSLRW